MSKPVIMVTLGVAALLSGCAEGGADNDESLSTSTEHNEVPSGFFGGLHVTQSLSCASSEVMIGIHLGLGRVICGTLNPGYSVLARLTDPPAPNGTRVGSSPVMHGCPTNYFVRSLLPTGPGENEALDCVLVANDSGAAVTYNSTYQDRNSPPTASIPTYDLVPNMHVCKPGFAMVGIQQSQNNLFCAD
jgi:hypothetical protein